MDLTITYITRSSDPADVDEDKPMVTAILRDLFRDRGHILDSDDITHDEPVSIAIAASGDGYVDAAPPFANGFRAAWTGTGSPVHTDAVTPTVAPEYALMPDSIVDGTETDVRVRHGHGGPVTVTAYDANQTPMGYLFAADVDDDTVHVEVLPGTRWLRITRDEDPT